jgi:hypothetical protein
MKFIKVEQTTKGLQVTYLNDAVAVADEQYAAFRLGGYYVDDVPPPEDNGMNYQLMYNPDAKTVFYEYTAPAPNPEDKIQQIEARQALMQQALDELILGGGL